MGGGRLSKAEASLAKTDEEITRLFSRPAVKRAGLQMGVSAATGFLYGSVLRASNEQNVHNGDFFSDRVTDGVHDMTSFGALGFSNSLVGNALGVASSALGRAAGGSIRKVAADLLQGPILPGAISGIPGGLVSAEVGALQDGRLKPTLAEVKENVASMTLVGTSFGAAHWLGAESAEGNKTNARNLSDLMGVTRKTAANEFADLHYKIVGGIGNLKQIHSDVFAGAS